MSMKNEMIPVTSGDDYDLIFWRMTSPCFPRKLSFLNFNRMSVWKSSKIEGFKVLQFWKFPKEWNYPYI